MCVIACTFTAVTTKSEKPCPSEISQKAGVRSASRAVKSRVKDLDLISSPKGSTALFSETPSTTSPYSDGLLRITSERGKPRPITSRQEKNAAARQAWVASDQATMGTHRPPSAMQSCIEESARARFFSNQWMSATLIGKKPYRLEPIAVTRKAP